MSEYAVNQQKCCVLCVVCGALLLLLQFFYRNRHKYPQQSEAKSPVVEIRTWDMRKGARFGLPHEPRAASFKTAVWADSRFYCAFALSRTLFD